jgi:hypothetical protein
MKAILSKTPERKRLRVLPVPTRIVLNEAGVSFFVKYKRRLHRFETTDGSRQVGFRLESVSFAWLKKLFLKGYIEKVEMQVSDIAKNNSVLSDAVKLVFFAMFRHRISLSVLEYIYNSPLLRSWNRANPKQAIGPGVKISEKKLWASLESVDDKVKTTQDGLKKTVLAILSYSVLEEDADEKRLINFIGEIVDDLDPLILFILVGSKDQDRRELIRNICGQISAFIKMIDILDMASLLTIELVSAAERSALLRVLGGKNAGASVLADSEKRKAIMEANKFRGTTIVVSVPKYAPKNNGRVKFRFSVYNDGADIKSERKLMEDFAERSYSFKTGQHLDEFFREAQDGYGDNGMRFYYLSILRDLCRRHNMLMDSGIKESRAGESLVTTLSFGF